MTRSRLSILIVAICAVVNLALALTKLYIGLATNSITIYSDSINNFLDVVTSIFGVIAFALAAKKQSKKFPNGLGRIEYLATFVVALVTVAVGAWFAYSSVGRLMFPLPVQFSWLYFALVAITLLVKLGLGFGLVALNKKLDSDVIKAISFDSFSDSGITLIALISFACVNLTGLRLEGVFGLIISVILLIFGIKLLVACSSALLGATNTELVAKIKPLLEQKDINYLCISTENYGKSVQFVLVKTPTLPDNLNQIQQEFKDTLGVEIYFTVE